MMQQPTHDDHRGHDEAHVLSLRLALGSILSPKRPQMTRSSTTSGTSSPATHNPYSSIPLSPSHSNSSAHPASHPHAHPTHPMSAPPHAHHPHQSHQHVAHYYPHGHSHLHTSHQPVMPGGESGPAHAMDDSHPHIPDALAAPTPTAPASGATTPGGRAHFLDTLQSKKSWDALIHGSWV
ncbi:hypothetical protein C8Q80DRAFT_1122763 [Daedaleopsis nitida]|nr:hypothetical protein C8Q80DRAFT_1122763 [Daedaleopsis nitida]